MLDGTVRAVDRSSGETLWTFSSGGPLVQAHRSGADGSDTRGDTDGVAIRGRTNPTVFPGIDGSLYAYAVDEASADGSGSGALHGEVSRLPVTARQLVEASPSVTRDGGVVMGTRRSVVFAVDRRTGELLRSFDTDGTVVHGGNDEGFFLSNDPIAAEPEPTRDAFYIGRTEYVVRSVDSSTGQERWNVTYGEVTPLTSTEGGGGGGGGPLFLRRGDGDAAGTAGGDADAGSDGSPPRLEWGPGNAVRASYDGASSSGGGAGRDAWIAHMPSTPVAAYDGRTGRVVKGGSPFEGGTAGGDILVGAHGGGLFALPSTDGGSARGLSLQPPGDSSLGTVGALVPVAVSPTPSDDDWACIPEKLWDDALTPGGLDSFLALHGGGAASRTDGSRYLLTPLQRVMGSPVGAAAVVTVAVGFGTFASHAASIARRKRRGGSNGGSNGSKRGSRGKNRGRRNKGKGGAGGAGRGGDDAIDDEVADEVPRMANRGDSGGFPGASPEPLRSDSGAVRVGRLSVGPGILGYGSCGTIVFEGELDGRPVAVKRLLAQFHELARAELATLISSDEHPNVLRCFAMEEDADFVYVALERCSSALASVVDGGSMGTGVDLATKDGDAFDLVDPSTGRPTPEGMTLMRDVCEGLHALHSRGIVHRDLKPQNVLITPQRRGKLADMGLAKRLGVGVGSDASFETHLAGVGGTDHGGGLAGSGTAGWQAPERLLRGKQARSVDTFALGCLMHYCLTGGEHPFGERYERDANVIKGDANLASVRRVPEAADIIGKLIARDADARPSAAEVLSHPFWWSDAKKLAFLVDVSDRVEMEDREVGGRRLLSLLERDAMKNALGGGEWVPKLDPSLLENLGRYRKYNAAAVRDLLRVIRNKMSHFRELPAKVQATVGSPPDAFYQYFASRFPGLLLHAYAFAARECAHESMFRRYFFPHEEDTRCSGEALASLERASAAVAAKAAERAARRDATNDQTSVEYPVRPGEPDCVFWIKTGRCKFGAGCKFNHPSGLHG